MNLKKKAIWLVLAALLPLCFVTGCAAEENPYLTNDAEGYTVSVKFDANGGFFTTNTSVMVDSYSLAEMTPESDGDIRIPLIAPDDAARGKKAFTPLKNGYFLAGWYAQRSENTDSSGNVTYTYAEPWDFAKDRLSVDPSKAYTAQESVLTLYAAWVPLFEVAYYDLDSGEYLQSYTFDPAGGKQITLPVWDTETGTIEMNDLPQRKGYTYEAAYYDAEGKQSVSAETLEHTGVVDWETGVAKDPVMKLYVDYTRGDWYHIYTAEQFVDNASVSGSYVIHADLDFTDEVWPTSLMHGNFSGTIQGNGHSFSNITFAQTNNSKVNSGLFGSLTETAVLKDLTFENVTFTIEGGTRVAGAAFGVLAGTVSDKAQLTAVALTQSQLLIDSGSYFGTDDYAIGLVSSTGVPQGVTWEITCQAAGSAPERLVITVEENAVSVDFVSN